MHIQDIPQKWVPYLARLLQYQPHEDADALSHRILRGVKQLPSSLKPSRLEMFILPSRGHLCKVHKYLHHDLVETILQHIQREVGTRLNDLVSHSEMLSPEQYSRVLRLRGLHALWTPPQEFQRLFCSLSSDSKWAYQNDGCGACIVSKIASDLQILFGLRCAFRSRATRAFVAKHGTPRLQPWVHVWIATLAGYVEDLTHQKIDLDGVTLQNEEEAILLKKTRADIDAARHGKSKKSSYATSHSSQQDYNPQSETALSCENGLQPPYTPTTQVSHTREPTSSARIQQQAKFPVALPMQSTVSTVCAEPSTRGQSPYSLKSYRRPEVQSVNSIQRLVDDGLHVIPEAAESSSQESMHEVLDDYVPPRSLWNTAPLQNHGQPIPSSTVLPLPDTINERHGYDSTETVDSWERSSTYSTDSSDSWQTEQCETRSKLAFSKYPPGSSTHVLARNPAETYTNLIHTSPFSESNANLLPRSEQHHKISQAQTGVHFPSSASQLFLTLYDEVCRSYSPNAHAQPTRIEADDGLCHLPATSYQPRAALTPPATPPTPSSEFEEEEVPYSLPQTTYQIPQPARRQQPQPQPYSTASSLVSPPSPLLSAQTAARLATKRQHDKTVDRIVADLTQNTILDSDALASSSTQSPLKSNLSVATQGTTWSSGYDDVVSGRDDLSWYYGDKSRRNRRK